MNGLARFPFPPNSLQTLLMLKADPPLMLITNGVATRPLRTHACVCTQWRYTVPGRATCMEVPEHMHGIQGRFVALLVVDCGADATRDHA